MSRTRWYELTCLSIVELWIDFVCRSMKSIDINQLLLNYGMFYIIVIWFSVADHWRCSPAAGYWWQQSRIWGTEHKPRNQASAADHQLCPGREKTVNQPQPWVEAADRQLQRWTTAEDWKTYPWFPFPEQHPRMEHPWIASAGQPCSRFDGQC
jgi:hypothetical protein